MIRGGCKFFTSVLLLSSALPFHADALVFSSSLKFKLTQSRVTAQDFQNYLRPVLQSPVIEKQLDAAPAARLVAAATTASRAEKPWKQIPNSGAVDMTTLRGKIPVTNPRQARVFVVDEEALLNGKIKPVPNAYVSFVTPEINPDAYAVSSAAGIA